MSHGPPSGTRRHTLYLISLGIGVIGVALTIKPPAHPSPVLFWGVLATGLVALALGSVGLFVTIRRPGKPPAEGTIGRKRELVGVECSRLSESLSGFAEEQQRTKPRGGRFGGGSGKQLRWREEVKMLYRKEFQTWALETFDAAAELLGVAPSSRRLVENPSPDQLHRLTELFRDASQSLRQPRPNP